MCMWPKDVLLSNGVNEQTRLAAHSTRAHARTHNGLTNDGLIINEHPVCNKYTNHIDRVHVHSLQTELCTPSACNPVLVPPLAVFTPCAARAQVVCV